jgi:hypothetical protein
MFDQNPTTYTPSASREILHPAEAGLRMTSTSFDNETNHLQPAPASDSVTGEHRAHRRDVLFPM